MPKANSLLAICLYNKLAAGQSIDSLAHPNKFKKMAKETMFGLLKRKNTTEQQGQAFFESALAQAQDHGQQFFQTLEPTDDVTLRHHRFETVALFMAALLWRLKQDEALAPTAQFAYDKMFASFDRSLREAGVGDIGVSHRIKKYAQAFHGRLDSYGKAYDAENPEQLTKAFENNIKLAKSDIESIPKAAYAWAMELKQTPAEKLA